MDRLRRLLGVEPEDFGPLSFLALRVFLASVAVILAQTYQTALFLDVLGASLLPWQYAATAVVSVALTAPYGALQRRWGEAGAEQALLGVLAAGLVPGIAAPAAVRVPAALFVFTLWVQLAGFLANLGVWDAAVRAFPGRRARLLLPIVSAGATVGCIVGGLLARGLASFLGNDSLLPLVLVLTLAVAALSGRPPVEEAAPERGRGDRGMLRQTGALLARNPLARNLVLLVILAAPLFLAVDFAFKRTLGQHYSVDGVAAFLGDYYLWVNLAVLVAQTLVMGRLMARAGVAFVSLATPVAVLAAAALFVALPGLAAAVALAFVGGATRYTFFQNGRNQLLTPLSPREKGLASLFTRAVVTPVGSVLAGLVLVPVSDASTTVLGLAIAAGSVAMLAVAWGAGRAYRAELLASLRQRVLSLGRTEDAFPVPDATALAALRRGLREGTDDDAVFCATLLAQWGAVDPPALRRLLSCASPDARLRGVGLAMHLRPAARADFLAEAIERSTDPDVVEAACDLLAETVPERAAGVGRRLLREAEEPLRRVAGALLWTASGHAPDPSEAEALRGVLDAAGVPRTLAVRAAGMLGTPWGEERVRAALRDEEARLRRAALQAVGAGRIAALFPEAERALADPRCRAAALEAIVRAGRFGEVVRRDLLARPRPEVAPFLARALARRAPAEADLLRAGLETGRVWVRALLLEALERGDRGLPGAVDAEALERSTARAAAALTLAGHRAASPPARLELEAEGSFARRAAFSLLRLRNRAARRKLAGVEASLASGDARQRNAALELLEEHCRGGREWLVAVLEGSADEARAAAERSAVPDAARGTAAALAGSAGDRLVADVVAALEGESPMEGSALDPKLLAKAMTLRHSGFFRSLATETLLEIAARGEDAFLGPGDLLFAEGTAADGLYFVAEGRLDVLIRGKKINELGPGAVLGEIALLDRGPRTATVRATGAVELLKFSPELFDEVLEDYPDVSRGAITLLVEHIRRQCAAPETGVGGGGGRA
jgi:hypothetical protein